MFGEARLELGLEDGRLFGESRLRLGESRLAPGEALLSGDTLRFGECLCLIGDGDLEGLEFDLLYLGDKDRRNSGEGLREYDRLGDFFLLSMISRFCKTKAALLGESGAVMALNMSVFIPKGDMGRS